MLRVFARPIRGKSDCGDDRQIEVLDVIRDNPEVCNQEISEMLLLPINRITGRVKELRDLGLVVHVGFKKYNNRRVMIWSVR